MMMMMMMMMMRMMMMIIGFLGLSKLCPENPLHFEASRNCSSEGRKSSRPKWRCRFCKGSKKVFKQTQGATATSKLETDT